MFIHSPHTPRDDLLGGDGLRGIRVAGRVMGRIWQKNPLLDLLPEGVSDCCATKCPPWDKPISIEVLVRKSCRVHD